MAMYTYKNKTDHSLLVVGHGTVAAGATFQSPSIIENPNIEFVSQENAGAVVGTEGPQPNAVTDAKPVNQTTEGIA